MGKWWWRWWWRWIGGENNKKEKRKKRNEKWKPTARFPISGPRRVPIRSARPRFTASQKKKPKNRKGGVPKGKTERRRERERWKRCDERPLTTRVASHRLTAERVGRPKWKPSIGVDNSAWLVVASLSSSSYVFRPECVHQSPTEPTKKEKKIKIKRKKAKQERARWGRNIILEGINRWQWRKPGKTR